MRYGIFAFLSAMWILMLAGGGIAVIVLGPLSLFGDGEFGYLLNSAIKGVIAIIMVIIWILVLSKLKNWIFRKTLRP